MEISEADFSDYEFKLVGWIFLNTTSLFQFLDTSSIKGSINNGPLISLQDNI